MPISRAGTWTSSRGRAGAGGRAFTLLELIVVLVVVGICATAVFPKLRNLLVREPEPWYSGRQFLRLAKHARELAIATGSTFVLSLDTDTGNYWIAGRRPEPAGQSVLASSDLKGRLGEEVRVAHVELSGEDWDPSQPLRIEFDPEGACDAATIGLISSEGRTVNIGIGEWSEQIDPVGAEGAIRTD